MTYVRGKFWCYLVSLGGLLTSSKQKIKTQKDFQQPEAGGIIQRDPDLGTRVKERIETVKEAVEEASEFLQHKADEAGARPE